MNDIYFLDNLKLVHYYLAVEKVCSSVKEPMYFA